MNYKYLLFFIIPVLFSCSGSRNLVYFDDIQEGSTYTKDIQSQPRQPIIQYGDRLSIKISSANAEASAPFNKGGASVGDAMESSDGSGYLVDEDGMIIFPVLGSISLGGLSKKEAKEKLEGMLVEYLNTPIVDITYLNYKVTVVGEVNNPSTFIVPSERINIIEALGMAGDMTVYGKRDNVLLIKESGNKRTVVRLNLNDKAVLNSPYYYLEPNDMVYVEPVRSKKDQASLTRANISILLSVLSVISFIIFR